MANWRYKLELNQIIANCDEEELDGDDLVPEKTRYEIINEISELPQQLLEDFRVTDFLERLQDEITVEEFDDLLSDFYSWADENLVWCGLTV